MSLAQSADHQENANIGCRIVHSDWGAGHSDVLLGAGGHVNVVVSCAVVTNVLEGFR